MNYSLHHKMLLSLSMVTFIGLTSLLFAANKITEQNTSQMIKKDMIEVKNTLDIYLKQYFLIKDTDISKTSLESEAMNISNVLSSQIGSDISIYDASGNNLSSRLRATNLSNEDLTKAIHGKTAYSVNFSKNKVIVTLSFPIETNQQVLGIMRYSKNYTEQYQYDRKFQNTITIFAILIFIIIFITSMVLSRKITNPISKLTKSTEQISAGNFDLDIGVYSRDEIGELAGRFKKMALRIKEQIEIIELDRDALRESQAQNKVFFDNVTHELKTPLTTILGYAQVLQENGFSDKEFFDKGTSYIIKESNRLTQMVMEIIELSKGTSNDFTYYFQKVDLSLLVSETSDEMRLKSKKYHIRIDCDIQDHLYVVGDRDKLKEVLINILDNSIKYGNVNSTIRVIVFQEGNTITLKVIDQGEGIPVEQIDHLFQPFYRIAAKPGREKGSAGLGLSIVKSIVEKHNGTIQLKSKIHTGTEVEIQFKGENHE
ncbi:HAMP domain-containing sensor histidine kinase [Neobacillus muris]|uniref:HAMP domain-containing sensor histidine kinase n=1 Tax=Neobacillus muris TaxID=2941334 RepID=UPI00203F0B7B|nr:HAMP domain-containing sensor histidine kinase [Neobacillus muris]